MGGIGKTTLAEALHDELMRTSSFVKSCFLRSIRDAPNIATKQFDLLVQAGFDAANLHITSLTAGTTSNTPGHTMVLHSSVGQPGQHAPVVVAAACTNQPLHIAGMLFA